MFIEKEFTSEGSILRGRLYTTEDSENAPCIVMCHGTSATVPMALSSYAIEFQNKGFNVFFMIIQVLAEVMEKFDKL